MIYLGLLAPLLIALYTISYGRWLSGQKQRLAAYYSYFLALITILAPAITLFMRP
ncbi:hypothetical protein [Heliophilum fasciatum]|uniref:Uncharacterized protein n=1 Tax=Heliophilum fasciatum TaxID=35700 RepID=A0A4R2RGE6_9FIRM|nr:hypothetical protein [Heliophilum fasciatum]MCW2279072.1 hypothetical protein [Heliophilum fasciatum]TCP61469.1 hypothetical protein EDD73_1287 [Heliophilum fasciatum]